MKTEIFKEFPHQIVATRLDEENLEEVASFYGGNVKGTALPRSLQVVDFYNPCTGEEQRANIGDWVVRKTYNGAMYKVIVNVITHDVFLTIFYPTGRS